MDTQGGPSGRWITWALQFLVVFVVWVLLARWIWKRSGTRATLILMLAVLAAFLAIHVLRRPLSQQAKPSAVNSDSTAATPDEPSLPSGSRGVVFGSWRVTGGRTCPNVCAMSDGEIAAWQGRTAFYADSLARFGTDSCSSPRYRVTVWTENDFLSGLRSPARSFGIERDSTVVIDIGCPDHWTAPGSLLLVKDQQHLLTMWDGVVFELTRQ